MGQNVQEVGDKLEDIGDKLEEAFDDALDVGHDLSELRGILSSSLGDLPFAVAIVVVVAFSFVYTLYGAFFVTIRGNVIESDCYCDANDRLFYRFITFGFTSVWIFFLLAYGVYSTFFHSHVSSRDKKLDEKSTPILQRYHTAKVKVDRAKKEYKEKLIQIVSATVLNIDRYYEKKIKLKDLSKAINQTGITKDSSSKCGAADNANNLCSRPTNNEDQTSAVLSRNNSQDCSNDHSSADEMNNMHPANEDQTPATNEVQTEHSRKGDSCHWNCFMSIKVFLMVLRFIFRLLIVPLLQYQWLNNYAWICIMNGVIRNYCETHTNHYFIGLDHSLVLYVAYVLILVALTFSIIISWLPKGTPQLILHYDHEKSSKFKVNYIDIKRKKTF